jgi:chromosome condensin MukBEF ATPase and DNA-binding subunit MukB
MKTKKEEYVDKMAKDLKEWSATIDEFEADSSRFAVEFQEEFATTIRDLKEKRDLLKGKLQELMGSAADDWMALQTGVEKAKHDLGGAFDEARDIMNKAA